MSVPALIEKVTSPATSYATAGTYLGAYFTVSSIPTIVSVLTGVLVLVQMYKAMLEIRAIRNKG